jgi:CRISPR-associated protein Csm4
MLDAFSQGGEPPFVLSDAWPESLLPVPLGVPLKEDTARPKGRQKSQLYIHERTFMEIARGERSTALNVRTGLIDSSTRAHNAEDRSFGSAADGQLYEIECQHLVGQSKTLNVYVRAGRYFDEFLSCFRALSRTGFGKRHSVGFGEFRLLGEPERCDWLDDVPAANAFVALSHFVPKPSDPSDGFWETHVTHPKFYANSAANVFKGAILMLTAGSIFRTPGQPIEWYGRMISVPRPEMPKAVHYGLCFAVPAKWLGLPSSQAGKK